MKHLDVRHLWLQDMMAKGAYSVKKLPRADNPGDVLTHAPSSRGYHRRLKTDRPPSTEDYGGYHARRTRIKAAARPWRRLESVRYGGCPA